jgi:hypothetical protein
MNHRRGRSFSTRDDNDNDDDDSMTFGSSSDPHDHLDGLHHRSRRSASAATAANNNNLVNTNHNMPIIRSSRLFHSYNNPYHGNNNTNNRQGGGRFTLSFARVMSCLFAVLMIYFMVLLYTHVLFYTADHPLPGDAMRIKNEPSSEVRHHQSHPGGGVRSSKRDILLSSLHRMEDKTVDHGALDNNNDLLTIDQTNKEQQDYRIVSLHDFGKRRRKRRPTSDNKRQPPPEIPFAFNPSRQQYYSTEKEEEDMSSSNNSMDSNTSIRNQQYHHLDVVKRLQEERRLFRKRRSTPPSSTQQQQREESDDAPPTLWYKLDHSSYNTILTNQKRWEDDNTAYNNNNNNASASSSPRLDTSFHLCGKHARQASFTHPQNYYPPLLSTSTTTSQQQYTPLNSSSRVLITGILSTPLGFHLALALHRQCNITNFIGVDSQIPNDPLSRLEMMDRLEVLLEELSPNSGKSLWYVPFLGLEPKQPKNEPPLKVEERERRQRQFVKIRNHPHHYIIDTTTANTNNHNKNEEEDILSSSFNTRPYVKYGIPLSPGVNENGYGTLDLIAEYRPTHIVHLAGTQSDSLLNSNKRRKNGEEERGDDDDEEESSISSRPQLYELRMGMVGMEQLLSSVVAQTMILPSQSSSSLAKDGTKIQAPPPPPPHVVYASSYDARYFSETSKRLNSQQHHHYHNHNHHNNTEIMLGEGEDQTITKRRKYHSRPPRGFHGVSHLINEILATTFHGLHGISSIGLRFDAIYGPRGFGVPSNSVPLLNIHRMRKQNVGVSPDVVLAEVEVRRKYRKWMKIIKDKNNEKSSKGEDEGAEEEKDDDEISLIEESGWLHASHHPRDFVFVEGKETLLLFFWIIVSSLSLAPLMHIHFHSLSTYLLI